MLEMTTHLFLLRKSRSTQAGAQGGNMLRILGLTLTTVMAAGAFGLSLESNRKLIITDKEFPADKYILDQASIMVELYYRMDEDEALVYDPVEPSVVCARIPLRNLQARQAEDSLSRYRQNLKA